MLVSPFVTQNKPEIQEKRTREENENLLVAKVLERALPELKALIPAPIKGDKGDKGDRGERGEQGVRGERGIKGDTGPAGRDGVNGKDGKDGISPEVTREMVMEVVEPYIRDIKRELAKATKSKQVSGGGGGGASILNETVTTDTKISTSSQIILADASGGAITVTLPVASHVARKEFHIKKIDTSAYSVTIAAAGSDTIDGDTSYVINYPYNSRRFYSDGSNWFII